MARTTINSQGVPAGTITASDLTFPLADFSSTGIDDNASSTSLTIDSSGNIAVTGTVDGRDLATDGTKLDNIEANADVTDATNVTAAGALMDSELTDLAGVKGVTISTLQPKPSEGAFANGDKTKLDGIATGADVTPSWVPSSDPSYLTSFDITTQTDSKYLRSDVDDQMLAQLYGGFGAVTTGGTTDWNHSTNARSGGGYTLLTGSASNGPGGSTYYHPFSFEYNSKNGNGNMTQLAIPYNGSSIWHRYRYSSSWTSWLQEWNSGNDGSGSGLDADNLDGTTWGTQNKEIGATQLNIAAGNLQGLRFWNGSNNYRISMSAIGASGAGRMAHESSSDYNMYFKMSAGTNRGFVFKNGSTNVFGIDGGGRLQVTGDIYGKAVANQYSNLYRFGGLYLGWDNDNYGVQFNHSITSGFGSTTLSDDITINSYNRIRMNIDTNNNNSNEVFQVGIHTTGSGNTLMTLANNGNFSVTGNVTAYSSDKRLKKNFKKIDNALDKVLSLNGYNFDWRMDKLEGTTFKPDFETNDVGLIAQEVEAVCEQATGPAPFDIQWDENNEHQVSQSGEDYLTVNYDKLVPVLVEAIKEQQETIEEQKNLINRLEERLNKLEENNG